MALPELEQAATLLKRASHVLLIVPPRTSADAFASMVALYVTLQAREGIKVDEVSPSHVPGNLQFLPGSSQVKMRPQLLPDIVLDLAGPTVITEVRQESLSGGIRLHITLPEGTPIKKDQLEVSVRPLPYDVAVTFGVSDLEELGPIFTDHVDFFYNTPIINIDHRADNEHFGTVNLVDITASSVAEVTHELARHLNKTIESTVATALYAGIVAGTDSFQKPSTSPKLFKIAAELLEQKADREAVIQHLIKTKPLSLLKLVGRLYARLRYDEHVRLFWSVLRPMDFQDSSASADDILPALYELTKNISNFSIAYLIHEKGPGFDVYVLLGQGIKKRRADIQSALGAHKLNGILRFTPPATSLADAEQQADQKIRPLVG